MSQGEDDLAKLAFVVKYHAERSQALANTAEKGIASLLRSAEDMAGQGDRLVSAVASGVRSEVSGDIKQAVDRGMAAGHQMYMEDAQAVRREREALAAVVDAARREIRGFLRVAMATLVVCTVGAFAGIGAWGMFWANKAEKAKAQAEWLERLNNEDRVPCGTGTCANVDLDAEPIGDKKQYYPVKPRP